MYSGQYSYSSTPTNSAHTQAGYFSSSDSHRAMDDKERQYQTQQLPSQSQSLPSIHEALGSESSLSLYPGTPNFGQQSQHNPHAPPTSLSSNLGARANGDGPSGPPNPFSSGPSSGSMMREPSFSQPTQAPADVSRSSLTSVSSTGSRNASINSPTQSARTGITSIAGSQASGYEYGGPRASASSAASGGGYGPFSQSFSFQQPQQAPAYPVATYPGGSWKSGAADQATRPGDVKGDVAGHPGVAGQPHADSTKRQLEFYDVETPLHEVGFALLNSFPFHHLDGNADEPRSPISADTGFLATLCLENTSDPASGIGNGITTLPR